MADLARALASTLGGLGVGRCMCVPGQDVVAVVAALEGAMPVEVFASEVSAGFAADGYRRADPRGPDVPVLAAAGKGGAAHLALPLENALADHVSVLAVAGRCAVGLERAARFHAEVGDASAGPDLAVRALEAALGPPQGPALLTLDRDAQSRPAEPSSLRPSEPDLRPRPGDVERAASLLARAERPLLLLGAGCRSGDVEGLRRAVAASGVPCATTLPARGLVDEALPCCLGAAGLRGTAAANSALRRADAVLAAGCSLSSLTVPPGSLEGKRVLRADAAGGDVAADAASLAREALLSCGPRPTWAERVEPASPSGGLTSRSAVAALMGSLRPGDRHVYDIGAFTMWAGALGAVREPGSFLVPHNLYPIGYALPAAVGADMRGGARRVAAVCGDAGFLASAAALPAASERPMTVVVLADGEMGIIRHRLEALGLSTRASRLPPLRPSRLAEACGMDSVRVSTLGDLEAALEDRGRGPCLVECAVSRGPAALGPLEGNRFKSSEG